MAATAQSSTPAAEPRPGLRERKKIKTRIAIREATYRLIEAQGYDATTIEQIAEAAEVSPSTVFRYFPTKEDIVLTDEYDPLLERELRERPADEPWFDSLRHVMHKAIGLGDSEDPEVSRLRTRLMVEVPAVRSRMMESVSVTGRLLSRAIAERVGRDPDSLEVRVFAMSLVGGLLETSMYWAETGHRDDFADLVERTLGVLEHGLPPGNPEAAGTHRGTGNPEAADTRRGAGNPEAADTRQGARNPEAAGTHRGAGNPEAADVPRVSS